MPEIYRTGVVPSVLDAAREPEWAGRLGLFDSLLAEAQTAGRGQFRRHWCSPKGNVYAALRLPVTSPFAGTEAAVALGAWTAAALRELGYPCLLKWPNDVVLPEDAMGRPGPAKVCGILLEERGGALFAGMGVNVVSSPADAELRDGAACGAASLSGFAARHNLEQPDCGTLWKTLVNRLFSFYSSGKAPDHWRQTATDLLLWRGRSVTFEDGDETVHGIVCGVGSGGELVLSSRGCARQFLSGSIRRCDN